MKKKILIIAVLLFLSSGCTSTQVNERIDDYKFFSPEAKTTETIDVLNKTKEVLINNTLLQSKIKKLSKDTINRSIDRVSAETKAKANLNLIS